MTARFRRRGDCCVARFVAAEASMLRQAVGEIVALMDEHGPLAKGPMGRRLDPDDPFTELDLDVVAAPRRIPHDPALARLLPDAYRQDPDAANEMRRLTEGSLRSGKMRAARQVLADLPAAGGPVSLDDDAAQVWLTALNDVRLALGTRLDITDDLDLDEAVGAEPDSERAYALAVYSWFGWLQETLVEAVMHGRT